MNRAHTMPKSSGETDAEDLELIASVAAGNEDVLSELYRRYSSLVHGVAAGVLRSAELADEVTQEVFVGLWQRPNRFDPTRGSLRTFLRMNAQSRAIDLLRSEQARSDREQRHQLLALRTEAPTSLEDEVLTGLSSDRVRGALERLRPEERSPIAIAFFHGLPYRAVAEILQQPEGTVKSRIRLGMLRLRELLREEAPALG